MAELQKIVLDFRMFRGITQAQLAKISGVSLRTIINVEQGKAVKNYTLVKLMKAITGSNAK